MLLFCLTALNERFTGVVKDFEVFKVLVVRDESVSKTLMDTVEKKGSAGPPPAISVTESWRPKGGSEGQGAYHFSVTEVAAQSVGCVPEGGIYCPSFVAFCGNAVHALSCFCLKQFVSLRE